MTIQNYLSQINYLSQNIAAKTEQAKDLKSFYTLIFSHISLSDGKIPANDDITKRRVETAVNYQKLEKEISEELDQLLLLKQTLQSAIEHITEPKYRILLTLRYLNNLKWAEIAQRMNYDERWVRRLHKPALALLSPLVPML